MQLIKRSPVLWSASCPLLGPPTWLCSWLQSIANSSRRAQWHQTCLDALNDHTVGNLKDHLRMHLVRSARGASPSSHRQLRVGSRGSEQETQRQGRAPSLGTLDTPNFSTTPRAQCGRRFGLCGCIPYWNATENKLGTCHAISSFVTFWLSIA